MGAKTETKMIADREGFEHMYSVTQLSAKAQMFLKLRIAKAIAPGLGGIKGVIGAFSGGEVSQESPLVKNGALDAIEKILMSVDPTEAVNIIEYVLVGSKSVIRDDARLINLDAVYTGDLMEMYKAAAFVLEVNFADFFGVLEKLKPISAVSPKTSPAPE